jgi:hypothetical protein
MDVSMLMSEYGQLRRLIHARSMSAYRTNAAILNEPSMAALPPPYPGGIR